MLVTDVRMVYPKLFTPYKSEEDKKDPSKSGKYSANFWLPKSNSQVNAVKAEIKKKVEMALGPKAQAFYTAYIGDNKDCFFRDGDAVLNGDGDPSSPSHYIIAARRREEDGQPILVNGKKEKINPSDGLIYSGCYVNASIDVWVQVKGDYKGIRCKLVGVQFLRHGEPLGGSAPASDKDFQVVESGDSFDVGASDF
jgi:hypothetical protein